MKVLYVITQADGGGAQKYTLTLARNFKGMIAAGNEAKQLFTDAGAAGIQTFELKHLKRNIHLWHDLLAIFEIARLIKKTKPDVVHLNSTKAGFLGSIAGKLAGTKVIFTAHGFRFLEPLSPAGRWFYLLMEKIASYFRDYIIAVSDVDRRAAIDHHVINANKIVTIHNGIPAIQFMSTNDARSHLGFSSEKIRMGAIGGLYKTKGFDVLIDAMVNIDEAARNNLHLTIIGDGPECDNLKSQIPNLNLSDSVALLGKLNNASAYLKAFDVLVISSRKEGLPYTLLEAMQAGLPIVATRVGGIPEALGDAGLLVEPANAAALADAIEKIVNDKNLAGELAAKAKKRSESFTEVKMLQATEQIYRKIAQTI